MGSTPRQWEQDAVDAINALDVGTRCVTADATKFGMTPAPRRQPRAVLIGATRRVVSMLRQGEKKGYGFKRVAGAEKGWKAKKVTNATLEEFKRNEDVTLSFFCSNSASDAFVTLSFFQLLSAPATRLNPKPSFWSSRSMLTTRRVGPINTALGWRRVAGVMPAFLASSVTHRVPTSSALMASCHVRLPGVMSAFLASL